MARPGAYTKSEIEQAVAVLTAKIKGLTTEAARVWVRAEQGQGNNVLGVTDGRGHLYSYPSVAAGAEAAARLFNTSRYYASARAIVAGTASASTQLRAIAASPWNGGHYRKSTAFAPYLNGSPPRVTVAGTAPGLGATVMTVSAPTPTGPPSGSNGSAPSAGGTLADYLGLPGGTLLTVSLARQVAARAAPETGEKESTLFAFYFDFVGHRLDTIAAPGMAFNAGVFGGAQRSPAPLDGLTEALRMLLVNSAILATILGLGYLGARRLLG